MKIPRDIGAAELAKLLKKYGYAQTRQTGSHIRLSTYLHKEHHLTIPNHKPIRVGTLNNILSDLAKHLEKSKQELISELFIK